MDIVTTTSVFPRDFGAADEERDDILRDLLSRALKMKAYLQTLE